MALDRDSTLKKAEKLLRQGRLDAAIAEYIKVVEEYPRDWNSANTLGDLYGRAGQTDKAIAQYTRIAEHFSREGFYPKAAALYKKILKITPDDERPQLELAEISVKQGLLADAKSHFNAVATRRRGRGDRRGAAELVVRLGSIDPGDFEARLGAARMLEEMGEDDEAGQRFKGIHDDLLEKGRTPEALDALREYVRLNPLDRDARGQLARIALEAGDLERAREYLDRATAGDDPTLLLALAEIEVRAGETDQVREVIGVLLGNDRNLRQRVIELAWSLAGTHPDAAFVCVDAVVDSAIGTFDFGEAAATLQGFVARVPGQIPALLKLVEVCVDGGLESTMYEAQELLTDAYLEAGQATEARVIAEDLVAREPWERAHIERFRRALVMLRVSDPDTLIAERLSGQSPFMAKDPFFDLSDTPVDIPAESEAEHAGEGPAAVSPVDEPPPEATPEPPATGAGEAADDVPVQHDSPASVNPEEIDLTGALGGLDSAEPKRRRSRKAGAAKAPTVDDSQEDGQDYSTQHMTLARTYLEIGMVDEAISSLQRAARAPQQRFGAASMLGRLYVQRNDVSQAIEWLERAAEAPAPTVDDGRSLLYDLGVMLDTAGETARALAVFLELQADAGDYRDVPSRIDRLARVQAGG